MTDIVIIALLIVLILKDFITIKVSPKEETHKEVKEDKDDYEKVRLEKEFNGIMNYSIDDAIQSKRGDN